MNYNNCVHRRYNPLLDEWVLVSPHRNLRPWQGSTESLTTSERQSHDSTCYLCPGNTRASGATNPKYEGTFVFDNDYPAIVPLALEPEISAQASGTNGLIRAHEENGICRVVCFHPDHSKSLAQLNELELQEVVETWSGQTAELSNLPFVNHIQIFENKGEIMGCSNPHPHGQIWAQEHIPSIAMRKIQRMEAYYASKKRTLLSAYLSEEIQKQERIVYVNDHFAVLVPYWAIWPFETMIIPRRAIPDLTQMHGRETAAFADAIRVIVKKYDEVFQTPFPYSAGIHQKPFDKKTYLGFHMHMQFFPPLLRSSSVKKFMVGYEMFGEPQRDITPEHAADILKNL